jgi:hypothetical protein
MTLANVVRLNDYTTDIDKLFKHWGSLPTRLAAPPLLVLLEATAVD